MMKMFSIPTFTAICLLIMTICTSVAVAQTQISTIEDLNNIRNNLGGSYVLTKDLDFAQGSSYASGTVNKAFRPLNNADPTVAGATEVDPADGLNPGFPPIGDGGDKFGENASPFTGSFEGNGFTIRNLYINNSKTKISVGLFGATKGGGRVQNLGIVDAYLVQRNMDFVSRTGGLVGLNDGGTISNCYFAGETTAVGRALSSIIGGLVGESKSGAITNCYTSGTASARAGAGLTLGGLVGQNRGTITNCYSLTTDLNGSGSGLSTWVGGLVGLNDVGGTISNCYATGNVTGDTSGRSDKINKKLNLGGLVGLGGETGTISNCYATGNVDAKDAKPEDLNIGGLIGDNSGTITNCYATGRITGIQEGLGDLLEGGLVGNNRSGTISNCFWDKETTGQTSSRGSEDTAGLTTADFKALTAIGTATNEDDRWSANDWEFGTDNEYPALRKYKTNDADPPVQIQGDLFCPQPAPRAEAACLAIAIATLGLENIENTNTAIRLSPNPVTDRLYVQGNGTLQVQVRNILGTTLLVTEIIETGDINVSTLPPGLYLVSVQSIEGTNTQTQRILKR